MARAPSYFAAHELLAEGERRQRGASGSEPWSKLLIRGSHRDIINIYMGTVLKGY